jgi:hypothetical protein
MTIIKNIINSAKKTWRGEEDPVKVFYTWGLACYIILPLFTFGLGYLSIVFLGKFIDILGAVMFTIFSPIFMPLLIDPLLTYILYSRNIHNVKVKNIEVKKRIVRGLLLDINGFFSVILFSLLIISAIAAEQFVTFSFYITIFIFSNAYRYYKYSLKYQLIFNEKLLNYKVPFTHIGVKYLSLKPIKKTTYKNISSKITINNIKIAVLRILYLPVFITKIILNILYLIVFVFSIIIRTTYIPIIIALSLFCFKKVLV